MNWGTRGSRDARWSDIRLRGGRVRGGRCLRRCGGQRQHIHIHIHSHSTRNLRPNRQTRYPLNRVQEITRHTRDRRHHSHHVVRRRRRRPSSPSHHHRRDIRKPSAAVAVVVPGAGDSCEQEPDEEVVAYTTREYHILRRGGGVDLNSIRNICLLRCAACSKTEILTLPYRVRRTQRTDAIPVERMNEQAQERTNERIK